MLDDLLLQVNKPGRYIGGEWNVSRKDFESARIKFALCFPDLYEVGMSNVGVQIIYGLLNKIPEVVCERFFACAQDMEDVLLKRGAGIFSLESKKQLRDFDIIGFSLGYELAYTTVLRMLDLGALPFESEKRDSSYPLVIAGGPCVLNPEPMHAFFDLFVLGEAEEALPQLLHVYGAYKDRYKAGSMSKDELLFEFSRIEGVYVPTFYEVRYQPTGRIESFAPKIQGAPTRIKKRIVADLEKAFFPLDWLVPYIEIIHDRISLEIMRGCPNRCRFCQARQQYYPFRQKSAGHILQVAQEIYRRSGYEEISLCGLSVSDYSRIEELIEALIDAFRQKGVSVSLPSIKPNALVGRLSSLIAQIKKSGLTFAPEAASERLRQMLAKEFDTEKFFDTLKQAFAAGYRHLKLYFMIGLPYETEEDLDGIVKFASSVSNLRTQITKQPAQVNLSINALIPKPHTPLQWCAMQDTQALQCKQQYLRKKARNPKLKLRFHNCLMSFLEGVLSRGDRRLSSVIRRAYERGCRLDSWENYFDFEKWQKAFQDTGIDPGFYLRERDVNEILPWDFLDLGVEREWLAAEYRSLGSSESLQRIYR